MQKRKKHTGLIIALSIIALLVPEWTARVIFGVLLVVNGLVFRKRILPIYNKSFSDTERDK